MLKIYNTLSRKKEIFRARKGKRINLFVCGITPYDFAHLGHARTYIVFDMIAKYLREKGYDVFYLQNITDIDDKILELAKREKTSWKTLSRKFEKEYLQDMKSLGVNSVQKYARATGHIKEIISQVKRLKRKGFAYEIKDGIYYDIKKFKNYGKLSRRTVLQAEDAVSRIDIAKGKRNRGDFCLWKLTRNKLVRGRASNRLEPSWPSPFGWGRPGWHIEDTAITEKYFGVQYDIHGGARDLIFPHHEAEIAQMEAISGKKPMVKYWLHSGFLTLGGKKMAKSLGNFITIRNFLKKHSPRLLRYFFLKSNYRSSIEYNEKALLQAQKELERIDEFLDKLEGFLQKGEETIERGLASLNLTARERARSLISKTKKRFITFMEDDLNTPRAFAQIFQLVNKGNKLLAEDKLSFLDARQILQFLKKIDKIFNFIFWQRPKKEKIPQRILKLVGEREKYRKQKNWKKADKIRRKIKQMGYWIEDTREGPKIKKIK